LFEEFLDESSDIIGTWGELADNLESLLPRIKGIFVIADYKLNESFIVPGIIVI
jgi:hypothetical protein